MSRVFHLVLRFSDNLGPDGGTLVEHERILSKYKKVWYGKFGKRISQHKVALLRAQIRTGQPTFAYLATKQPDGLRIFRATLLDLQTARPTNSRLIPPYYREKGRHVGFWLLVSNLTESSTKPLRGLFVASSGQPILDSLGSSMAGMFLVVNQRPEHVVRIAKFGSSYCPQDDDDDTL